MDLFDAIRELTRILNEEKELRLNQERKTIYNNWSCYPEDWDPEKLRQVRRWNPNI